MPWLQMDDGFGDHPKVLGLSDRAFRVHVLAMCWASRQRTDGHVPPAALRACGGTPTIARALVDAGLWEVNGNGWVVHDWTDHNPPSDPEERARWMARRRQRARRERDADRDISVTGSVTDA